MKVLAAIVIPPHLASSGAVNAAMAISQRLRSHCDIEVAMMSDRSGIESHGGLPVHHCETTNRLDFTRSILPNKFRTLFYRSNIASMVKNYDLVHIHNPIPALEMRRIAKACVASRVPYVVTTHGFVEVLDMNTAYRLGRFEQLAGELFITRPLHYVIRHANRISCLSPFDQGLLKRWQLSEDRLPIIPNGVDPRYFDAPSLLDMEQVKAKFGLPKKASGLPVCFFLANHTKNKGLDILIDAFAGTQRSFLLIVGGKKRDYDYEALSRCSNPNQRILFTDGLTDAEIRCLHHYADLFVFPSRADTLPLVILEAMASGRAVLSTRVGGIPFQVDATCGRIVEPEQPSAFRRAFEEMTAEPDRLASMGNAARLRVKELFDWERSAALTMQMYRSILP